MFTNVIAPAMWCRRNFVGLLPWIRDVFKQFHYSVRHVLECTKMDTFVVTEFAVAHVTMILDDFAYMLGRQVL